MTASLLHHPCLAQYCVIDGRLLLTGSFNWTSAAFTRNHARNCENILATTDKRAAGAYAAEFERLWKEFKSELPQSDNEAAIKIQSVARRRTAQRSSRRGGGEALDAAGRLPVNQRHPGQKRRATLAIGASFLETYATSVTAMLREVAANPTDPAQLAACEADFKLLLQKLNPRPGEADWLCDAAAGAAGRVLSELIMMTAMSSAAAENSAVLRALNSLIAAVEVAMMQPPTLSRALFWGGERGVSDRSRQAFCSYLSSATRSLDVCIFSITDDRIKQAIVAAHTGGAKVRVISDDDTTVSQ